HVQVVEGVHRVVEAAGVFQDVHQVALVGDRQAVGDVEDAGAAAEELGDDRIDLKRAPPEQGIGELVELPLGQRRVGPLRDGAGVGQLHMDQVADLIPEAVEARRAAEVRYDGVDDLVGVVPAKVVGDVY